MPLLAVCAVAVLLLFAWAAVEIDHVIHAYPAQFWFGVVSFLIFAFAFTAARFRVSAARVPLRPAPPPLPPALRAVPVLTAIASPEDPDAALCEGPGCRQKVDGDPWTARADGEEEHVFCSEACARKWQQARLRSGTRQS